MLRRVNIENFKSISNLSLELGRFNVFIGENGCGKSNILEAIAMGSAACANKLDTEFLSSRGIRVSDPQLMRSAFNDNMLNKNIQLLFELDHAKMPFPDLSSKGKKKKYINKIIPITLQNENKPYSKWYDTNKLEFQKFFPNFVVGLMTGKLPFDRLMPFVPKGEEKKMIKELKPIMKLVKENESFKEGFLLAFKENNSMSISDETYRKTVFDEFLTNFVIFSPENTMLRRFEDEEKIQPLGIKGEGLFKLLQVFNEENSKSSLKEVKENLQLIDWFEDFNISNNPFPGEKIINIRDKYIGNESSFIHQQSSNEGFLFLLFYLSLFISKDTPEFFAVDNVDTAFNPRLCSELMQVFNKLSFKHKKQVILTTHNPFILDGLDLNDDEQRLFVIRRNALGHTVASRINKPKSKRKLSEAWMLGYIGGLPKNF